METKESILDRFDKIIAEGSVAPRDVARHDQRVEIYVRVRTSGMNLVRRVCGADSDHYIALERIAKDPDQSTNPHYLTHCLGSIRAARDDFAGGFLFDLRAQVAAEILGDFLDQAQYLLDAGYHCPAASLIGAVLEDSLRKLSQSKSLAVPPKTTIEALNVPLAKAGAYALTVQKQITAWAGLRNDADHGHFDKVKREDVEAMLGWVVQFNSDYLN